MYNLILLSKMQTLKIHSILLFIFIIIFLPFCKKDGANPDPPKVQYAIFSDITNGEKLAGLQIYLTATRQMGGLGGGLYDDIIDSLYTDSDGKIEYRNNSVDGFDCTAPGFLPLHHYAVGLIDYDGLTHNVHLVPEAYLSLHLTPSSAYPDGYNISLQRSCGDPVKPVVIGEDAGYARAIDTMISISAGGDIKNEIRWALLDANSVIMAKDTIRNILVPRGDTGTLNLQF